MYDTALIKSQIQILGFFTIDLSSLIQQTAKISKKVNPEGKSNDLFIDPFTPAQGDSNPNFETNEYILNNEDSQIEEKIVLLEGKNENLLRDKTEQVIKPEKIELDMNLSKKKKMTNVKKQKKLRKKSIFFKRDLDKFI